MTGWSLLDKHLWLCPPEAKQLINSFYNKDLQIESAAAHHMSRSATNCPNYVLHKALPPEEQAPVSLRREIARIAPNRAQPFRSILAHATVFRRHLETPFALYTLTC